MKRRITKQLIWKGMYSLLLDNVFLEQDFIDFYVNKEKDVNTRRLFPVKINCLDLLKE
jgi:hypothetical protein